MTVTTPARVEVMVPVEEVLDGFTEDGKVVTCAVEAVAFVVECTVPVAVLELLCVLVLGS